MARHEGDIIEGCIKGDRRSQNALYEQYFPLLSSIALRYTRDRDEALHAVNYGFLKVLTNIKKYNDEYSLATWMRNIMVRHLIDEFRRNKHYLEHVQFRAHEDIPQVVDEVEEVQWKEEELRAMLDTLPEVTRNVFNMYAIDGFKHREIADLLGISEGTSKWHVNNARKKLKHELEKALRQRENAAIMNEENETSRRYL